MFVRRFTSLRSSLVAASLALAASPLTAAPQQKPAGPWNMGPKLLEEARGQFAAGELEKAATTALESLAFDPYAVGAYRVLYDVAKQDGDQEGQLRWGKWIYWSHAYTGNSSEADAIADELEDIWDGWNRDEKLVTEWQDSVQKAIRSAAGSAKQYRLAGHLYGKLLDLDPTDRDLLQGVERLESRAGSTASGGAFVADKIQRLPPKHIARVNRNHRDWENAFNRKTKSYEIYTNVSLEFFETVCVVMEEMNDFYRDIYDYNRKAPRLTLAIARRRSDFDRYAQEVLLAPGLPIGVKGWFYDKKLTVSAYDESEDASDLSDLWATLFHEASHHFTFLLTDRAKQDPPTWINEGTASYFEGCELKPDGSIVKNKPALNRVLEWTSIENSRRRHSLKEVITCPHRAYDGSFYSYGWALVYFLLNYEENDSRAGNPTEAIEATVAVTPGGKDAPTTGSTGKEQDIPYAIKPGKLVYRDAYLEYYQSYTKRSRSKDDFHQEAYDRAVEMFVTEIADPEVPDWAAFEDRWRRFMEGVVREVHAGPELADTLQARCRGYLEAGDFERALIAAEQADDKRPNDGETYRLLALAQFGLESPGDAVYWMVRAWEQAWLAGEGGEDLRAYAVDWLHENGGRDVLEDYCRATEVLLEESLAAVDNAIEDGHPAMGMLFASHMLRAAGIDHEPVLRQIRELSELSGHSLNLWLHSYANRSPEDNRQISNTDSVRYDIDGVLVNCPDDRYWIYDRSEFPSLRWLEPPFDMRGAVQIDGESGAYVVLGMGLSGRPNSVLAFRPGAEVEFMNVEFNREMRQGFNFTTTRLRGLGLLPLAAMDKIEFELQVDAEGKGEVRVGENSRPVPSEWTPDVLSGAFGVGAGNDTVALFSQLQVRTARPFWPVPPPNLDAE